MIWRLWAVALISALATACTIAPPGSLNSFAGAWSTAERKQIAFRDDTVVLSPPGQKPTPMSAETCDGQFRFSYTRQNRETLLGLVGRQADLRRRLNDMLTNPDYQVAQVSCGEGGTTYVMLSEKELVAIHQAADTPASNAGRAPRSDDDLLARDRAASTEEASSACDGVATHTERTALVPG